MQAGCVFIRGYTGRASDVRFPPIADFSWKPHVALMGTIGGKVGIVTGIIAGALAVVPLISLILGHCFFESGCGDSETSGLLAVAMGSVLVAITAGLTARSVTNGVFEGNR